MLFVIEVDNDGFKVYDSAGNLIDPAKDASVTALGTILTAIKDTDGIKKIVDGLPTGTNEIGKVAQGTKAAGSAAWPIVLYDASGNAVSILSDGGVYRVQTVGKLLNASGAQINPATEDTLALIKTTDGIKKIVDALPTGTNTIGKVDQGASGASAWKVDGSSVTQPISATSLPLPAGAATESGNLASIKTDLDNIYTRQADGNQKTQISSPLVGGRVDENIGAWLGSTAPTVGQKAMAASIPVVLPSDQTISISPDINVQKWMGSTAPTVGQKTKANSLPVVIASDQVPIPITFSIPGGLALPKMLTLYYGNSIGAIVANVYRRVYSYTVPSGYNGYVIRYTSYQGEVALSRLVAETSFGTLNINTNVFVAGVAYAAPQWSGICQAEVTTGLSSGSGNVTVTVTYTNESGVAGRTGTITIPKGSAVGSRWDLVHQAGDLGASSVQNMSASPTLAAGAIKLMGFIQLCYHEDGGVTALETLFAPGAITFPEGTVLGIGFAGGTVSKARRFDVLIQLTPILV